MIIKHLIEEIVDLYIYLHQEHPSEKTMDKLEKSSTEELIEYRNTLKFSGLEFNHPNFDNLY
jgi:hypothetical protein